MGCVRVRFYLDPETGAPQIGRHGVTEKEVVEAFEKPGEDRRGREGSRVAIGTTEAGRILRVIYVADAKADSAFVITAYDLVGSALAAYRRRRRRRGR